MTKEEFIDRYGGIYEHSPWVAAELWERRSRSGLNLMEDLAAEMEEVVSAAGPERQLALIRAHPDLAGKAAVRDELTSESRSEQASAGIDKCSAEEFERFQHCNSAYKSKFEFPFVMAVRGSNRGEILTAFERRLKNDYETEFSRALVEIHKIARLRLKTLDEGAP